MKASITWKDHQGQTNNLSGVEVRLSRDAKGYEIVDPRFQQSYYSRAETSFYGRTLVINADRQPPQLKPPTLNNTSSTNRFNSPNQAPPRTVYNQAPMVYGNRPASAVQPVATRTVNYRKPTIPQSNLQTSAVPRTIYNQGGSINSTRNARVNSPSSAGTSRTPAKANPAAHTPAPIITRYDGKVTTHHVTRSAVNPRAQRLQDLPVSSGGVDDSLLRYPLRTRTNLPAVERTRVLTAPINPLSRAQASLAQEPRSFQQPAEPTHYDRDDDDAVYHLHSEVVQEFENDDAVNQFQQQLLQEYDDNRYGVSLDYDSDSEYSDYPTADKAPISSATSQIAEPNSARPSTVDLYPDQSSGSSRTNSVRILREDSLSDVESVASSRPTIEWSPPSSDAHSELDLYTTPDYNPDDDRPVPPSPRRGM